MSDELRQAAQDFEAHTKMGGTQLWKGKLPYSVSLARVSGAKESEDYVTYKMDVHFYVQGAGGSIGHRVTLEALGEWIAGGFLLEQVTTLGRDPEGWGDLVAELMLQNKDAWIKELPQPF